MSLLKKNSWDRMIANQTRFEKFDVQDLITNVRKVSLEDLIITSNDATKDMVDEKFTMLDAKYQRDISDLQEQIENLTERLDSQDYYEDLPKAA